MFYEVFVRSFADSDGDGIGDLAGLTQRLDHLNDGDPTTTDDLGVTGIWLMPVAEALSYHGYDVTEYRAIEADYGTVDDFRALVAAAHERGIAVVVDLVLNHTSRQHPWFVDATEPGSAHDDWYVWADENPGYGGPDGQPVWHPAGRRFYYGLFWEGMPDLNLDNPAVTAELHDVAAFWLNELGVDGFRLDAAKHLVEEGQEQEHTDGTHAWLGDFHDAVHAAKPAAMLVGEAWDVPFLTARYVPDAVDLVFEFGLAGAVVDAVRRGSARPIVAARTETDRLYPDADYATFLTNHDQNRVASELSDDPDGLRLAAELLLTGPGVPFVYYGEEIGLTGLKPDERIRTPLPWTGDGPAAGFTTGTPWQPLEPGWETRNVAAQAADDGSLLSAYRELIRLRAGHPALAFGEASLVEADDDSLTATIRTAGGEILVVIANLGAAAVTDYALRLEDGPLCGSPRGSVVHGPAGVGAADVAPPGVTPSGGFEAWRPLPELPPRSVVVIELEAAP